MDVKIKASILFVGVILVILIFGALLCYFCSRCLNYCANYCQCLKFRCESVCSCFEYKRIHSSFEETNHVEGSSWSNQTEKYYGQETCGVCLKEININDDLYRAPCRHTFHHVCLELWLVENSWCPSCSRRVENII